VKGLLWAIAFVSAFVVPALTVKDSSEDPTITFEDVTQRAGISFVHDNGAFGNKYLPEAMGPGVGFIDYDNDGWPDIFLVNGMDWPGHKSKHATPHLYHNQHGTFTDVTHNAGVDIEMYGMGVAVGDYDNDGYDDLFVTAVGQSHLFHNNGDGTFTDVTQKAGLWGPNEFSASAAWVDYDKDGRLDLVVANYVQWTPEQDLFCTLDGKTKSYCTPESYKGLSVRMWHNRGDGTFEAVTERTGLADGTSKTLGITILDYDNDGWPDLLFSNDTQPNKLYRNNHNGTFSEKAEVAGIAFNESGMARAGMGVDAIDYDRSGAPSLLVTNFVRQMVSLYHSDGNGVFVDRAPRSELGRRTLLTMGFGCFFFDYDLDGWPDIFIANGHIDENIQKIQPNVTYAMPTQLFRNVGSDDFREVTKNMGAEFIIPRVGRGAAYADINNDGRPDILMATNGGPTYLFENHAAGEAALQHSLGVKLVGTRSNRDGIGSVVTITAGKDIQSQMLRSGSSYLSASEPVLIFGLARHEKADLVAIHWPDGQIDRLAAITAGQTIVVTEGKGVTQQRNYSR
jgi:hypothetical protein